MYREISEWKAYEKKDKPLTKEQIVEDGCLSHTSEPLAIETEQEFFLKKTYLESILKDNKRKKIIDDETENFVHVLLGSLYSPDGKRYLTDAKRRNSYEMSKLHHESSKHYETAGLEEKADEQYKKYVDESWNDWGTDFRDAECLWDLALDLEKITKKAYGEQIAKRRWVEIGDSFLEYADQTADTYEEAIESSKYAIRAYRRGMCNQNSRKMKKAKRELKRYEKELKIAKDERSMRIAGAEMREREIDEKNYPSYGIADDIL